LASVFLLHMGPRFRGQTDFDFEARKNFVKDNQLNGVTVQDRTVITGQVGHARQNKMARIGQPKWIGQPG
jgi:hypothetical protein